jgi:hypothetical protein
MRDATEVPQDAARQVVVAVVEPWCEPRLAVIQADEDGSYLGALQGLVGGPIEAFGPLFGDEPLLWVNEEGKFTCMPNRAVYANDRMVEAGYVSPARRVAAVSKGELVDVIFGTFVAACYDEGGEPRDIDAEAWRRVRETFGSEGISSKYSGGLEVAHIRGNRHARR